MAFNKNRVRVGGSGFTIFTFMGEPIAFAQQIAHTSAQPVGPGPVAIQPMDEPYPIQVITPAASGMGSLTLNLYEIYYSKVWEHLGVKNSSGVGSSSSGTANGFLNGAVDLVNVFIKIASMDPSKINIVKYIRPPGLGGEGSLTSGSAPYWEQYHNVVITNITDGEQIEVGTMEVVKQITCAYTHTTRSDASTNLAFALRDRPLGVDS